MKTDRPLLGFVGALLLMAVLLCLRPATWAAPEQTPGSYGLPIVLKYPDKYLVPPGQSAQFHIDVENSSVFGQTWLGTVVTDTIDSNLQVTGVGTSQGYAGWTDGEVTFTIGTMPPGGFARLVIYVEVEADAPQGYDVYNTAYLSRAGWPTIPSGLSAWMFHIAYVQYAPLSMRRYL